MKDLLPKYFSSQWSFAQCRVSEQRCLAVFGQDPATIMGRPLSSSELAFSYLS
jgi:hypothetical protein